MEEMVEGVTVAAGWVKARAAVEKEVEEAAGSVAEAKDAEA